jgi:bifunctional non-homologous end joining protein LigD
MPTQLDYLVIDLDPEEGDAARARSVTRFVGELLTSRGVESIPVATGSKGYHVWVPLAPGHDWSEVERTGRAIAGIIAQQSPDQATTDFLRANRAGRVFIDWLRNRPGATVVVPYSLRPRTSAPVAVPITWEELETTPPNRWTISDAAQRLTDPVPLPSPQELPVEEICLEAETVGVDLDAQFDRFGRS